MTTRARLDAELVRRSLAPSIDDARRAIIAGSVTIEGVPATRPGTLVTTGAALVVEKEPSPSFVSRGGDKLDGALRVLDVSVAGRKWLDAGASTGGFTDRLLQGGAVEVAAVDVAYGALAWTLRTDPRVTVLERTNVRNLTPDDLPWTPEGVVADLSFISLTTVLPALRGTASRTADFVLLVKPQFEAARADVGRGGVVHEASGWRTALDRVAAAGERLGLGIAGAVASQLKGPKGNREFFLHLRSGATGGDDALDAALAGAP
jgi:23S rRNA (cytidine1920-2'-O)/16S rRNA (cytidine1409-2'-O)-methyltransferase